MYSAPWAIAAAKRRSRLSILPGLALDLTGQDAKGMPWDFNCPKQRKKAEAMIDLRMLLLLIGSLMCAVFSHIQNLSNARRDPIIVEQELVKARDPLSCCCHLYHKQISS